MSEDWLDIYGELDTTGLWLPAPWGARLVVSGADARSFLQNFCTNDVLRSPVGSAIEAFFLNSKGHVLHHGLLVLGEHEVVVTLIGSDAADLRSHLDRYVIRERVEFQLRDTPLWLAVGGPWAAAGGEGATLQLLAEGHITPFPLLHRPAWIVESALTQESLGLHFEGAGYVRPKGEGDATAVFDALRIESGLPLPGVDYEGAILPQELDRNRQAIHFEKGCYLGQETVARLDALGHVNKLLRGIRFADGSTPELPFPVLHGEKEVGRVTSRSYSPRLGASLGLAIIRREAAKEGTELVWAGGTASVVTLPVPTGGEPLSGETLSTEAE